MICGACGKAAKRGVAAIVTRGPGVAVPSDVCGGCAATGVLIVVGDDRAIEQSDVPTPTKQKATGLPKLAKVGFSIREIALDQALAKENGRPEKGEFAIVEHLYTNGPMDRQVISLATGYARSTRDRLLQQLLRRGAIEANDRTFSVTSSGVSMIDSTEEPPRIGRPWRDMWLQRLDELGEKRILELLTPRPDVPVTLTREAIGEATGYARSTRDRLIQQLIRKYVVQKHGRGLRASPQLFDIARGA